MGEVGRLLCGKQIGAGIARNAFSQLEKSINNFSDRTKRYINEPTTDDTLSLGLFCSRVLLENSCAALLGRLDAFRVLYLCEFQAQPEYEHGKRARSSFSWFGDVMPDDNQSQLWNIDFETAKISRALFSKHLSHIYWRPAVDEMLDRISGLPADPFISELLSIDPINFIDVCRGKGAQLYSTLSKGVHWEFFSSSLVFDDITVKNTMRDTFLFVLRLGLASHFIPTAFACLDPQDAVDIYVAARKAIQ